MPAIKVNAFLQRSAGSATMRLWLLSPEHAHVAWFRDLDYTHALREEMKKKHEEPEESRTWGAFEASFFGPDFQSVEALSREYDERDLNYEFTRISSTAVPQIPAQLPSQ